MGGGRSQARSEGLTDRTRSHVEDGSKHHGSTADDTPPVIGRRRNGKILHSNVVNFFPLTKDVVGGSIAPWCWICLGVAPHGLGHELA